MVNIGTVQTPIPFEPGIEPVPIYAPPDVPMFADILSKWSVGVESEVKETHNLSTDERTSKQEAKPARVS